MNRRIRIHALCLAGLSVLSGCASPQVLLQRPKLPPLHRDLPAYQAPIDVNERRSQTLQEPNGELNLDAALALALMQNPALAAFSWEMRAREAQRIQAGLRPNPEFAIEFENFAGSGELGGFGGSETTVAFSQRFELAGKRDKRLRVAGFQHTLAAWDYESRRVDVLTAVHKRFVDVLAAQERVALMDELVGVAAQVLQSVSQRVRAGAVSPVEETRARVELEASRVESKTVRSQLAIARSRLAVMWSSNQPGFSSVSGALELLVTPPPLEQLLHRVEQSPSLSRWNSELETQRAVVELENARRVPDIDLGAGVRRIASSDATGFVVGVGIPLPLFDRNQGAVRSAEYHLEKLRVEQREARLNAHAELAIRYQDMKAAFDEATAFRDRIIPEAQQAADMAQDAYRRGLFRFTDVLDTQRTLFALRGRYFEALARHHGAVADIERLIAESLEGLKLNDGRP